MSFAKIRIWHPFAENKFKFCQSFSSIFAVCMYTVPWSYQGIRLDTDKNYAFSQVLIWICLDSKDDSTLNPEPRSKQID